MNECSEALNASQYHDGELAESQRAAFEAHLQSCATCQTALREYESLTSLCNVDDAFPFASEVDRRVFLRRTYEGIDGGQNNARERFTYPLLAAAVVLLFCTFSSSWMVLRNPGSLNKETVRWVEYMVNGPVVVDSELDITSDDESDLTEWMMYALSEDESND